MLSVWLQDGGVQLAALPLGLSAQVAITLITTTL
jgi:hypothetical protein